MDREDLRLAVYTEFAETGRAPTAGELGGRFGTGERVVAMTLAELAAERHLVLDDDGRIAMAHPFSAVPLGFSVMGSRTLWWGGCAWDSFAIPHLLRAEGEVLVATRCPTCGRPHAWNVGPDRPPDGDQVAHFLVPAARMWDDVVHTCANQRLFCSPDCVADWLTATGTWAGPAVAIFLIIGGLYYLLWGKNHYNGPIIMGSEDDMRKLEADVEKGSIYHEPAVTEPAPTLTPQRV